MSLGVAIVDDEAGIRRVLSLLVENAPGLRLVNAYASGEEAVKHLPHEPVDVVLMDIHLAGMSGIECVRRLKELGMTCQFIMLTVYEDSDLIFQSLMAGASGYLLKRAPRGELLQAIQQVHQGGAPMTSHIARKVVQYFQSLPQPGTGVDKLSARELEVLDHLSKGRSYKEISDALNLSMDTVRNHIRAIYGKLQVHSRTEALLKYLKR